jgi:F0F1-type ATP synthase membrane subunit c/vacuolar-type H+-ATPase subunit K
MANFKIETPANFTQQLRRGVLQNGSRAFFTRVAFNSANIINNIGNLLVSTFEATEVARSLRGNGVDDLAAHFGLTDSQADSLASAMAAIIRSSVGIVTRPTNNGGSVQIRGVPIDYSAFLGLPNAEYVSHPSNITIPVMRWLLLDPDIDIGQAAYDIVFSGQGSSKIDARIQKSSRSRRAIMVTLEQLGGGSGYVLPAIVRGNAGENFIEFVIRQPGVAQQVAKIVLGSV